MSRSWALWAPRRCCCQMPPSTWPAGRTSTTGEPSVHEQSCSASLMQLASFAQIWHKGEARKVAIACGSTATLQSCLLHANCLLQRRGVRHHRTRSTV